jgi:hypothetical protein
MRLSVVIPAFNERRTIAQLLQLVTRALPHSLRGELAAAGAPAAAPVVTQGQVFAAAV